MDKFPLASRFLASLGPHYSPYAAELHSKYRDSVNAVVASVAGGFTSLAKHQAERQLGTFYPVTMRSASR